jgi:hypothetical protein
LPPFRIWWFEIYLNILELYKHKLYIYHSNVNSIEFIWFCILNILFRPQYLPFFSKFIVSFLSFSLSSLSRWNYSYIPFMFCWVLILSNSFRSLAFSYIRKALSCPPKLAVGVINYPCSLWSACNCLWSASFWALSLWIFCLIY